MALGGWRRTLDRKSRHTVLKVRRSYRRRTLTSEGARLSEARSCSARLFVVRPTTAALGKCHRIYGDDADTCACSRRGLDPAYARRLRPYRRCDPTRLCRTVEGAASERTIWPLASMGPIDGLLYGLSVAATPENLLAALIGAFLGSAIGVLPGLGPLAGTALVLPYTFGLPPVTGLIMMGGIFYGSTYGGSTTSILLNIPGETASIVTMFEGYKMTKRGRGGAALALVAIGSFVAATLSLVGIVFFAPAVASFALAFGPAEFFALTVVALFALAGIAGGSLSRALASTALGLLVATVGADAVTGMPRFDFGTAELSGGIGLVPVSIGLYGITEVLFLLEERRRSQRPAAVRFRDMVPTREEFSRSVPAWLRGTGIGFFLGFLPGPMNVMSSFTSYRIEKAVSRGKSEFGHGAVEGVSGPEAANNASATSEFVPMLSLGLPFSPTLALILGAMMVHGIQPGPLLIINHPEIFWGIIASMYIGNVMLLVLNLPLIGLWTSMLRVPMYVLIPVIVLLSLLGTYSVRNSVFDMMLMLAFGLGGYILRKLDFPLAPLILAVVLGPLVEKYFRASLTLSRGDLGVFVGSPIANAIWLAGLALVAFLVIRRYRGQGSPRPIVGE